MESSGAEVKRILIVEDEPAICTVCTRVLTGEGFEVDTAANGKVAQGMIEEKQYDLFLIDIRMPEMNGEQLYQYIREKSQRLVNRVILTTGSVIGGDTISFLEKTGRPFLPKPFTSDELRAIVRETLRQMEE